MPPTAKDLVKSVVDRSVVIVLPNPDDTASRRDGVSVAVERTHRLYGTSLLAAATKLMKLNASTYATACTIFHRFYYRVSLTQHCAWSVAMASMLLATKVEDGPQQRTIRHIIVVFDHLYRKRRKFIPETTDPQSKVLPLNKLGPVWKEYCELILEMESQIMREMGFVFYFIPDSHPHKFLWEFLRVLLGLEQVDPAQAVMVPENNNDHEPRIETRHAELAQRAWNYCNDSCRLDLCVRFDSEVIVSVASAVDR
jgi:cyclin L